MKFKHAVVCLVFWASFTVSFAAILRVPLDYRIIQSAIDSSQTNDTVLISNGIYHEQLIIIGKQLTLASNFIFTNDSLDRYNTIIRLPDSIANSTLTGNKSTVRILNSDIAIIGLTFRNGRGTVFGLWQGQPQSKGGALLVDSSNFIMKHSRVTNNKATLGAGVSMNVIGRSLFFYCFIDSNFSTNANFGGSGVYTMNCDTLVVSHSLFEYNRNENSLGAD